MSFDYSGLKEKQKGSNVTIIIDDTHPLICLSNALPWDEMMELIIADLKATTSKGCWWLGRRLQLRIHTAAYILQQLYDKTDRQIEYAIKDNAAYQLFCGLNLVKKWHFPDHTKIEEFRSRLSPETQQRLANYFVEIAESLGFANPNQYDIDSTIQEANMTYPADVRLLSQLAHKAKCVRDYLKKKFHCLVLNSWK